MLFRQRFWAGLEDGSITVAFRRWKRPTVKTGGTLRTPVGMLAIDAVAVVEESDVTDADAVASGFGSRAELFDELDRHEGTLYRIDFHAGGPDPLVARRDDDRLTDADRAELDRRLARLDAASRHGAWTATVLDLIATRPATRAPDLAASMGRDTASFKADVRKLKALGLTVSLERGYRLSRRGRAYLGLGPTDQDAA